MIHNILFLCQHNSARSIFGEAIVNATRDTRFRAYSAGSDPAAHIHPRARALLEAIPMATDGLYPKHWDVFARADAPRMDFVFTVCDKTVAQTCPNWPGQPVTAHWGIADPARAGGDEETQRQAFRAAYHALRNRVQLFLALPFRSLDRLRLQAEVESIGRHRRIRE